MTDRLHQALATTTVNGRRAQRFDAAVAHLDWCAAVPHTVDAIIGIHAEKTRDQPRPMRHGMTNDEILSSLTSHGGGGGKGGHSDPTAQAALHGEPDAVGDDLTLAEVRATIESIGGHAHELDDLCCDSVDEPRWRPPSSGSSLTSQIRDATSRLHHARPLLDRTADVHPHADWLLVEIAESAAWLHEKCAEIWRASRGEAMPVAVQRERLTCEDCARHGVQSDVADNSRTRCAKCLRFRREYHVAPTADIVRSWDAGRQRLTPGMIAEAKAQARKRTKRSA